MVCFFLSDAVLKLAYAHLKFIVLMQQQNNRTDPMIIGIGAAHAGAPVVYYMGAV